MRQKSQTHSPSVLCESLLKGQNGGNEKRKRKKKRREQNSEDGMEEGRKIEVERGEMGKERGRES